MTPIPVSGKTQILAVIGHPVSHTASPAMQNYMCTNLGLDYIYVAFDILPAELETAILGIRALGIVGVNVTIPYKEAVIPFLDEVDPLAAKIGAVNTIVNRGGRLVGYNTDGRGFLIALMHEMQWDVRDKRVLILGAGGSGKSIAHAVAQKSPKSLCIVNRTLETARSLAADCGGQAVALSDVSESDLSAAEIVINTTAVGMGEYETQSPLDGFNWVHSGQLICDIIYNPVETVFLKSARLQGAMTLNGMGMLAGQGQLAFELFTGYSADYRLLKAQLA